MIKESNIDQQFNWFYKKIVYDLKKQNKEHYLKVKKLNNGIHIGKIKLQSNDNGFILRDIFLQRNNILYKEIAHRKSAIMLAVLLNKNNIINNSKILNLDKKYGKYLKEINFLKIQLKRFEYIKNYIIVDICHAKLTILYQNIYYVEEEIDLLYLKYVF